MEGGKREGKGVEASGDVDCCKIMKIHFGKIVYRHGFVFVVCEDVRESYLHRKFK